MKSLEIEAYCWDWVTVIHSAIIFNTDWFILSSTQRRGGAETRLLRERKNIAVDAVA